MKAKGLSRILVFMLAAAMSVSFFTGCGKNNSSSAEIETTQVQETKLEEETTVAKETEKPTEKPAEQKKESSSKTSTGVTPSFKETMDSYEEFMNDYVDFMKKYSESEGDLSMMTEYSEMLQKYSDFASKIDAIDEDDLSADDLAYYTEVITRVNKKLAEIG